MPQNLSYIEQIAITADPSAGFVGGFGPIVNPLAVKWGEGTGANAANRFGIAQGTLAGAGTATVNLKALLGPQGSSVDLAEVRWLRIETSGRLLVAKAVTNGWVGLGSSFQLDLPPGVFTLTTSGADGEIATGASNRDLLLTAGAGGATYRLVAVGTST